METTAQANQMRGLPHGKAIYVSIVIPCYNQAAYLEEAISSCLSQGHDVEVIVVNDGSTDETDKVASRFNTRIRLITTPNQGRSKARNLGARIAAGKFLLFLDADDRLEPGMLAAYRAAATAVPDADVYYGGWLDMDLRGQFIKRNPQVVVEPDAFHTLLKDNVIVIHAGMILRSTLMKVGCFDIRLHSHEDWDLWMRLAARGATFAAVGGEHVSYRRYDGSSSSNLGLMAETQYQVVCRYGHKHKGCATCKRLRDENLSWMRWHYVKFRLLPLFNSPAGNRKRIHAMMGAAARCFRDPALSSLLAKTLGGAIRRQIRSNWKS